MSSDDLHVYLDCQDWRHCDRDHFRSEIPFVRWVRDQEDAHVHVIFTSTGVGSGGREYTLDFLGREMLEGEKEDLTYRAQASDVEQEILDGLTETLRLGLLRYVISLGYGRDFHVEYRGDGHPDDDEAEAREASSDRWRGWVFRARLSGNMDVQETRSRQRLSPSLNADRVTEDWKVNLSLWGRRNRESIELSDGREIRNDVDSWRVSSLVVRSLSPHWSVGFAARGANSVRDNYRSRLSFLPAVEWNYFPYEEATRRQLIAHYGVGVERLDYYEETIFEETEERLPRHRLAISYSAREPWGNAGVSLDLSQYLRDRGLYSAGAEADLSFRVTRGLEFNVSASASRVNDQVYIPADPADDEDVLIGRQALPTSYRYGASIGFSYRWGSSDVGVVNNRFPRSVRD